MSLPHASRLAALCASLVLGLTSAGCSTDGPSDGPTDGDVSRTRMDTVGAPDTTVQVRTTMPRVLGRLSQARRERFERDAGRLVSEYLTAAYLLERPSDGYRGAFPGFTTGARDLALRDVDTTSDASFSGADEVSPRGAVAFLSVVASEGRAVGATARIFLDLSVTKGSQDILVEVRGRLLLSPTGDGWRIFGYDLSLDTEPAGRKDLAGKKDMEAVVEPGRRGTR